jgi:hypothetical protein
LLARRSSCGHGSRRRVHLSPAARPA